jgi:hypothetical protein
MKKVLFTALVLASSLAHAYDRAKRISVNHLFIPLGERCEQYYSLYPPEKICLKGQLHYRVYEIVYEVRGVRRVVRLTFIPEKTFDVDSDGSVRQPNHTIRPDQSF